MELIIKIPDKVYNQIKSDNGHGYCTLRDQDERVIVTAICNCTPYNPVRDTVSRSALKHEILPLLSLEERIVIEGKIDNAQTVEPKRPKGEWLQINPRFYKCSVCGRNIHAYDVDLGYYPFCHCGADMRGCKG